MDLMALVNSGINFLLYCSMSSKFRRTFRDTFFCPCTRRSASISRHQSVSHPVGSNVKNLFQPKSTLALLSPRLLQPHATTAFDGSNGSGGGDCSGSGGNGGGSINGSGIGVEEENFAIDSVIAGESRYNSKTSTAAETTSTNVTKEQSNTAEHPVVCFQIDLQMDNNTDDGVDDYLHRSPDQSPVIKLCEIEPEEMNNNQVNREQQISECIEQFNIDSQDLKDKFLSPNQSKVLFHPLAVEEEDENNARPTNGRFRCHRDSRKQRKISPNSSSTSSA